MGTRACGPPLKQPPDSRKEPPRPTSQGQWPAAVWLGSEGPPLWDVPSPVPSPVCTGRPQLLSSTTTGGLAGRGSREDACGPCLQLVLGQGGERGRRIGTLESLAQKGLPGRWARPRDRLRILGLPWQVPPHSTPGPGGGQIKKSCPSLKKEIFINNLNNTVDLNGHTLEAYRMVRKEAWGLAAVLGGRGGGRSGGGAAKGLWPGGALYNRNRKGAHFRS